MRRLSGKRRTFFSVNYFCLSTYVQPAYRAKKYGLKLAKEIISAAEKLNYEIMWLDTLIKLKPAVQLYKKPGFVETEPYYNNPYEGVVFMRKNLK